MAKFKVQVVVLRPMVLKGFVLWVGETITIPQSNDTPHVLSVLHAHISLDRYMHILV